MSLGRWSLLILVILIFSGCAPQPQDCARPDVFCVGLVTDFGPVYSGIRRDAWMGLQDAKAAHLVDRIDAIQTVDARDRYANISVLADEGYDLIVTVGSSIADETRLAAVKYPDLHFIGVEQPEPARLPNLTGLVFHEEQGGFLAGSLAALVSSTGRVAAVCESRFVDPMRRYCDGFEAGAKYVRPDVSVSVTYRDGSSKNLFNDLDWGRTTAVQQVDQGADVLFAAGGGTADAALQAAAAQGADVIGAETDLYSDLPAIRPRLLSSAMNDVRAGVNELILLARQGRFPSGEFTGPVKLAPLHDFDRQISPDVKQRLERIQIDLGLGTLATGVPYTIP